MPWIPSTTLLGTVKEFENFSYSIQYYEEVAGEVDPVSGVAGPATQTYYPVYITPSVSKTTIVCDPLDPLHPKDPATIIGYFKYCFDDSVQFRGFSNNIVDLASDASTGVWEKLDLTKANYITNFTPDATRQRTFYYTATAMNGSTVMATLEFSILVSDRNWTPGKNKLKESITATESRRS